MMDEAINKGDGTGGVWEHLVPFGEGPVGGDDGARLLVTTRDELEEEVGMAVGVGEVADLVARISRGFLTSPTSPPRSLRHCERSTSSFAGPDTRINPDHLCSWNRD
jgi:hypothetical protein